MKREIAERFSPFGEADCESEVKLLQGDYSDYFFYHTRFNAQSLDRDTYLIIGRRGSGKTALGQFFSFQQMLPQAIAIDVDEPVVFERVLEAMTVALADAREIAIPRLAKVWDFVLWSVIFRELQDQDPQIRAACIFGDRSGKISSFIRHVINGLLNRVMETETDLVDQLAAIFEDSRIQAGKEAVFRVARRKPVIVAVDTLENYGLTSTPVLWATAALIQCGSEFNRDFAHRGVHIKIFAMAEIFPYLRESIILNPLKCIRNEIYLHWRPKDLMRLVSWRFSNYLRAIGQLAPVSSPINWDQNQDVLEEMWKPYFGADITNGLGRKEETFPYVLRHTQMRPRQLIVLCNGIALEAKRSGTFPRFSPETVVKAVNRVEVALAEEVINSYSSVYPKVGRILEALSGLPMIFKGNELDKRASHTASEWQGDYSPLAFRQLVAELGVVGRVRYFNAAQGIAAVDFEYSTERRLPLLVSDLCAIHPMFYRQLNVQLNQNLVVYPFPDHEEYQDLHRPLLLEA
ncbi:P-loop ATPase, Sll1717 family [Prochlorothrix hollandica]|uniref:Uncharacterized protein n=1 Tax=Prochlorothrix hollandica PCC 9006 = CALU 1027 TaxID=317619 RepID=A0A0M2PYA6_PROHO|nr:hypothetical protein [Prochlorothrix hollandica]KKI99469.1 hypothetical protein PROH_12780 [Prochlorothrix hollandica PCC 9006 = CALU 1027]KKJ01416.1 hypothetical protein PROH_03505 [Prochlorothrix hollandica PCC 9006 = CALU 1027]